MILDKARTSVSVTVIVLLISSSAAFAGTATWNSFNDVLVSTANENLKQVESHLAVRDTNDAHLAAALMDNAPSGGSAPFRCRAYSSSDGAQSWSDRGFLPLNADTDYSNDPVVTSDASGNMFIVCLAADSAFDPSDISYWFSSNGGISWSGPNTVVHSTGGVVINDKPWIAADTKDSGSPYEGNVYVCWTEIDFTPNPDTNKIKFKKIWPSAGAIRQVATGNTGTEDPGTGEIQFCQVTVGQSGIIYVTWQRLNSATQAKIQLKRSFDGGDSFETFTQTVRSFTRFPESVGTNCPTLPTKLWGCLPGDFGTGIETPAIHSIAIDSLNWNVHVAYSDYDVSTLADIRYTKGTSCTTSGVSCSWSTSQKIVKDGNVARDQFDPAIGISPDTNTIHVTAMDRRNSADNTAWQPWHYHCHLSSTSCTSSANWSVTSITTEGSFNFDSNPFIGHYHGVTTSAAREANTAWTDTRLHFGNQDYNIFSDWTT
jgi:hypothetical protein